MIIGERATTIPHGIPPELLDEQVFIQGQKYLFHLKKPDRDVVATIADRCNVSLPVARILYSRGYDSVESVRSFLFTSYDKDVPHASLLKGGDIAVARIMQAIENGEKILISGDYDVDGITSSSLLMVALLPLGAKINFFLPHRVRDGYGLSVKTIRRAAENGYSLVITVDNGITAHEPAMLAKELGIDLIITDHHRPHEAVPEAYTIVNPNLDDCSYPFKHLAGVGVAFKLAHRIYEHKKLELPDKVYELLMLGTIADVMPLLGENRYWVRHGLARVNAVHSYAMQVLKNNAKLTRSQLSSLDMGFMIAPQLNALGRLSDPRDAVKFLISAEQKDVDRVGEVLFEMNEARKRIERDIYEEVAGAIESRMIDLDRENIIVAAGSSWPPGVIGLVAGRLMNQYGRPTLMFHVLDNGLLKGSCRSIPAFNMFDALHENRDLLLTFGGHSLAAGLSLTQDNLAELKSRLERKISDELTPFELQQKKQCDAEISLTDVNGQLIRDMAHLEPFGHENRQPLFLVRNVSLISRPRLLKDKHVKCSVFMDGVVKPVIFFNRPDLYTIFERLGEETRFHVLGSVVRNEWNGRVSIELIGEDIALLGGGE